MLFHRTETNIMDAIVADHITRRLVAPAHPHSIPTIRHRNRRIHIDIRMRQRDVVALDIETIGNLSTTADRTLTKRRPRITSLVQIKIKIGESRPRTSDVGEAGDDRMLTRIRRDRNPCRR